MNNIHIIYIMPPFVADLSIINIVERINNLQILPKDLDIEEVREHSDRTGNTIYDNILYTNRDFVKTLLANYNLSDDVLERIVNDTLLPETYGFYGAGDVFRSLGIDETYEEIEKIVENIDIQLGESNNYVQMLEDLCYNIDNLGLSPENVEYCKRVISEALTQETGLEYQDCVPNEAHEQQPQPAYVDPFLIKERKNRKNHGLKIESSEKSRNKHYTNILGKNYREKQIFDTFMQEDTTIGEYLDADEDNMLMIINDAPRRHQIITISRKHTQTLEPLYECVRAGSMAELKNRKYLNLASLGCPCQGVVDFNAFNTVLDSKYRMVFIKHTLLKTKTMIEYALRYNMPDATHVGNAHCQSGSERSYYKIYIPINIV